jgi:hypothetical protein
VVDVWNGRKYLNRKEKERFCEMYELCIVPIVGEGYFNKDELMVEGLADLLRKNSDLCGKLLIAGEPK